MLIKDLLRWMLIVISNSCMGIMNNVTQSLLGIIFERTTMLIIEKRITYELVHENIKELKSIHLELA